MNLVRFAQHWNNGLKGEVPAPINLPLKCIFHRRCLFANDRCVKEIPHLIRLDSGAHVACHGVKEGRIRNNTTIFRKAPENQRC